MIATSARRMDSFKWFVLLMVAGTGIRLCYLPVLHLVPQETYYWLFAKHLDLSYFDHPPMVAWSIALSTGLGGDSVFFVRLPALLFLTGTLLASYRLAFNLLDDPWLALAATALMSVTPVFNMNGVIITPDSPLLFFWAVALLSLERALATARWWWWQLAGICLGLAMLSKYTGGLLGACTLLFLLLSARQRRWLVSPQPYLAALTSLLVFSPVLFWNAQHQWASFAFQSSRRVGMMDSFNPVYAAELMATQMALVTPLVFIALLYATYRLCRRWWRSRDDTLLFLLTFSLPVLMLFAAVSLRTLVKMNWPAPAYVTGLMVLAVVASWRLPVLSGWWRRAGLGVALVFTVLLFALPVAPFVTLGKADTWTGWPLLAEAVRGLRAELPTRTFIFSRDHKISSELVFALEAGVPVLTENTFGETARQFDFWSDPETFVGWDAILVYSDASRIKAAELQQIRLRFERLGEPRTLTVERGGRLRRQFFLVPCFGYKGPHAAGLS